jgi:hypothetical protein
MSEWLDTETKAMLQQAPPEKLAPPDTGMFTLVLLQKGNDLTRIVQALTRIPGLSREKAEHLAKWACPLRVAGNLSFGDAMLGQFELVCCDSIAVFLRDEVVASAERQYLAELYQQFLASPEFERVTVTVASLSDAELGERFVDQFLGGMAHVSCCPPRGCCYEGKAMRKKARIMAHWAEKIGAEVVIADAK